MKTRNLLGATFIALGLAAVHAATATWTGNTSTAWATPGNWANSYVAIDGDDLVIADSTKNGLTLDTSHSIGSLQFGTTGTRTGGFTFIIGVANTIAINGGITADGGFSAGTNALKLHGHTVIPTAQTWSVGGSADHSKDQGVAVREADNNHRGSLTLDADLTKTGVGQLSFMGIDVTGPGSLIIGSGNLKLNAGNSQLLAVGGTGNLTVNGSSVLAVYKNSGTMNITRPIVMNGTSSLVARNNTVDIASSIAFNGTHTLDAGGATNLTGAWTGSGTVNRTGSGTLTVSGNLAGYTGALNNNGGTTNLIGGSNFGGSLNVNAGTVNMSGSMIGNTLTVAAGATFNGEPQVLGDITLNGGAFSVDPTASHLSTTANLALTGTNTVNLTGVPASSEPFTVLSYTGSLSGGAANLVLAGGAGNYRTPTFSDATPGIITLALGSESRTWTGAAGTAWDINGSTNWAEGDQKFLQLDAVTFTDVGAGTVAITGAVMPSSITVNSTADYTFTASGSNLIAGAGSLTKRGAGTLTLGGANTFSGDITVNAGILKAAASAALGANGKTITVADGATLDVNSALTANRDYNAVIAGDGVDGTGAIVSNGTKDQQAGFGSLTLTDDASIGGSKRFDLRPITAGTAFIDLAGFALTKRGPNKIAFIDGTLASDGTIDITEGTLSFTRVAVSGNGPINVHPYATLQFENNTSGSFAKDIAAAAATVLTTGNAFAIDSDVAVTNTTTFQCDAQLTVNGTVTGSGSLTKTGAAALVLAGDATLDGQAIVNAGTLQIGNGGTTGTLAANIENNAAVAFNRSGNVSYGDVISGTGGLAKLGAGTLTLTAVQQYTGTTAVNAGTLRINVANALPAATAVTLSNTAGVTLDLNDRNQEIRSLRGGGTTGGAVTNSGTGASILTLRPAGTDDVTFSGTLDGNVRLVVAGDKAAAPSYAAPRQRLAGTASTYTGGTVVDGGTLLARTDGSLGAVPAAFDPANITLLNNGTLFNGAADFVLTLDANRGITLGTGGGALAAGFDTDVTVQGVITGDAGNNLTILENRNTVVLTADNTYLGDTIVQGPGANGTGRLQIGDGGTTGTLGAGDVVNDGQITFNRADDTSYDGSISGSGTLAQAGSGTLTLNGANSYSGNTTVSGGTLVLGAAGTLRFVPTAYGISNMLAGNGTAVIEGTFNIDLAGAQILNGNRWMLVDAFNLAVIYGPSFNIAGFTQDWYGVWTLVDGTKTWTFDEATGILSLTASGFFDWIGWFYGLSDITPGGDPDRDGISNLLEYVLGGDPSLSDPGILPVLDASGPDFVFTFTRRADSTADTVQVFQYGSDLTTWTDVNLADPEVTLGPPYGGFQLVTVTIPKSAAVDGKLFGRLVVSQP